MLDKHTLYLLDKIESLRKEAKAEPSDKSECEFAIVELLGALVDHQTSLQA